MALNRLHRAGYGELGLVVITDDELTQPVNSLTPPMIEITGDGHAKPYTFKAVDLDREDVIIL